MKNATCENLRNNFIRPRVFLSSDIYHPIPRFNSNTQRTSFYLHWLLLEVMRNQFVNASILKNVFFAWKIWNPMGKKRYWLRSVWREHKHLFLRKIDCHLWEYLTTIPNLKSWLQNKFLDQKETWYLLLFEIWINEISLAVMGIEIFPQKKFFRTRSP